MSQDIYGAHFLITRYYIPGYLLAVRMIASLLTPETASVCRSEQQIMLSRGTIHLHTLVSQLFNKLKVKLISFLTSLYKKTNCENNIIRPNLVIT